MPVELEPHSTRRLAFEGAVGIAFGVWIVLRWVFALRKRVADQVGGLSCRLRGVLGHDSPQLEGQGLLPRLLLAQKKLCMSPEACLFLSGQVLTGQDENGKIGGSCVGPPFRQQLQAAHLRQQQVQNHQFRQGSGHLSTGLGTIGSGGYRWLGVSCGTALCAESGGSCPLRSLRSACSRILLFGCSRA